MTTFISNRQFFLIQIIFHAFNMLLLASMFNNDMAIPDGCYNIKNRSTLNCQTELQQNAMLNENINFHVFCGAIFGFVITCSNTLLYSSLVNVFRNEYQNRKFFKF